MKKMLNNYLQITKVFCTLSLICFVFSVQAQEQKRYAKNGSLELLIIANNKEQLSVSNPQAVLKKYLKTESAISFVLVDDQTTEEGNRHQKFQQYYKNIRVEHGIYILHSKNNRVYAIGGEFYPIAKLNTNPKISEPEALQSTLKTIGAEKYAWQDEKEEALLKEHKQNKEASHYPKAELVVWHNNSLGKEETYHLAYKFSIHSITPKNYSATYYVDTETEEILAELSNSCNVIGNGLTAYNGVKQIESTQISPNSFSLADPIRNIQTRDSGTNGIFTNTSQDWLNTDDKHKAAIAAHWGVSVTYDYFLQKHNRDSYDGLGGRITNFVDADGYDNASYLAGTLSFGKTPFGKSWASIEVVGHEWAHGLCQETSRSVYSGESGALNESLSDIWGIVVKHNNVVASYPFSPSWLIGEDFRVGGLRDMSNPKSKGHPDTYEGEHWVNTSSSSDNGGVHSNSGVLNYWFYMLCEGKVGVNDNGNNYDVVPIGMYNAAKIVFRTEASHLTPNDGYIQMANKSLLATSEIFGICSQAYQSVWNAWYAVGVFNTPNSFTTNFVSFPTQTVCDIAQSYNFGVEIRNPANDALVYNNMYRWQLANGSRTIINGVYRDFNINSSSVTVTLLPTAGFPDGYWETITATPLDCSNFSPVSYRFWVGKPDPIAYIITPTQTPEICPWAEVSIPLVDGATRYKWNSMSPSLTISSGGVGRENYAIFRIRGNPRTVRFNIVAANECSVFASKNPAVDPFTYSYQEYEFEVLDGSLCRVANPNIVAESKPTFVGYPNPAENIYTIGTQGGEKQNFSYKITNSLGITVLEGSSEIGEDAKLDVSSLANGLYVVQIQNGEHTEFLKFVVQKGVIAN
jgi:Zn-dependent metalloprotease